jgi:thiol-disulfide isomerase/thioredoxin
MVLDQAEKELGTSPRLQSMFGDFRRRYALLGTPAAPVTGTWWLNTTAKPASVQPGQGRVLLVEFTAHWCMPCKNSYPGMRELAERFKGKPFEGVLVTSLYGFLGSQRNLTPDQEVAADEIYFTKEHELPYKVAINPSPRGGEPQVDVDYRVGGIPQIAIVDKQGVIRQIVTGWDRGNTERIGNLIQQLIDEK